MTALGDFCFAKCSKMTSIVMLPSTPPSAGEGLFNYTPLNTIYVVDEDAEIAYIAQTPWRDYEIVVLPKGIEDLATDKTDADVVDYYDLSGLQLAGKQRGLIIVRYSDGTSLKVMVK